MVSLVGELNAPYGSLNYLSMLNANVPIDVRHSMISAAVVLLYRHYSKQYRLCDPYLEKFIVDHSMIYYRTEPRDIRVLDFVSQYIKDYCEIMGIPKNFTEDLIPDIRTLLREIK